MKRKGFIQTPVRIAILGFGIFAAVSILRRQDRLHLVAGTVVLLCLWWGLR
jgi:hypothetical protein